MGVVKVVELVGESQNSWQEAAAAAVTEASQTIHNIRGVEVYNLTAEVDQGRITGYKANVKVAFVVDRREH